MILVVIYREQILKYNELLFAMKEFGVKKKELEIVEGEWLTVWMLEIVKMRLEAFYYQDLRNIVKESGDDVLEQLCKQFKELKIEGMRKKAVNTLCMGRDSDARWQYQNSMRGWMYVLQITI